MRGAGLGGLRGGAFDQVQAGISTYRVPHSSIASLAPAAAPPQLPRTNAPIARNLGHFHCCSASPQRTPNVGAPSRTAPWAKQTARQRTRGVPCYWRSLSPSRVALQLHEFQKHPLRLVKLPNLEVLSPVAHSSPLRTISFLAFQAWYESETTARTAYRTQHVRTAANISGYF